MGLQNVLKKKIYIASVASCFVLLIVSSYQVFHYCAESKKQKEEFDKLAEIVEQTGGDAKTESKDLLNNYQKLFNENNDMIGWIAIDGTQIQYPVMYTPDNPGFYLKHSFKKEHNSYGVPYIAEYCDPIEPSDNVIIYGHHMKDGTMFAGLMDYADKEFYEKHKIIQFDTLTEQAKYEVVSVFKTTVYDNEGFKYYEFADAEKREDFENYVKECKSLSLYDTGVSAVYGDKLITLSTCEYSVPNGRFVVVAKRLTSNKGEKENWKIIKL